MVTDGEVFGAAKRFDYVEPPTIGFDSPAVYGFGENTERPNPDAGRLMRYWTAIAGWTVWSPETEWESGDFSDRSPKLLEPTHWAPMPELPVRRSPAQETK